MHPIHKILVPTDFSEHASFALEGARQLARNHNATVVLVHVVDHTAGFMFTGNPIDNLDATPETEFTESWERLKDEAQTRLKELSGQKAFQNIDIRTKVIWGNPYHGMARDALKEDADLVIMGSKGATGLEEVLIGSNAERMIRNASCPVIVVKQTPQFQQIKHIALMSELEPYEQVVLDPLLRLRHLLGAELHVARINTPHNFISDRKAHDKFRSFIGEKLSEQDVHFHHFNDYYQHEGVENFASSIDAGLIAMGTHGRKGVSHFLLGSLTEQIVNETQRPVWTMRMRR